MAIARFTRGATTINFDAWNTTGAIYRLGDDFVPPPVNMSYNISAGTSANRTGGGSLISKRANNRQFTFSVICSGSGEGATRAAVARLQGFIANDTSEPLYFEVPPVAGLPEPLWGQLGAWLRYEVVTGDAALASDYGTMKRGENVTITVTLEVKPSAVGSKQKAINASGGVFENNYGTADGTAKGLSIFEGTTNKILNPVFGHATYNNGWSVGTNLIETKNTDTSYTLPGQLVSAKLTCSSAGSNNGYLVALNCGNANAHSFSAYVMRPDMGACTSADCEIYYNSIRATSFTNIGNGLYCAFAENIAGTTSADSAGIIVSTASRTVYLLGYQVEEKAYHTPLCYGDLLGCAWSSSAHDSTSVRTVSNLESTRTDEFISIAQGAVSVVFKPYYANTSATEMLFATYKTDYSLSGLRAYFNSADDKFTLEDGTNTITTAAQTFSGGDTLYLTFMWGPGGLNIYKSGANAATGATYTPPIAANTARFEIGNGGGIAGTIPLNGDLIGFDVYETELTAAQCLALYTAQLSIVSNAGRVSTIPWLWTKDGDGIVDNCNDSTYDNWCVVGGVPGSCQAETLIDFSSSGAMTGSVTLSCLKHIYFVNPSKLYYEFSSTASDSNCSAEDFYQYDIGGSWALTPEIVLSPTTQRAIFGKEFYGYMRCYDSSSTTFEIIACYSFGNYLGGLPKSYIELGSSYRLVNTYSMNFPDITKEYVDFGLEYSATATNVGAVIYRNTGSGFITIDYFAILTRPILEIKGITNVKNGIVINGNVIRDYDPATRKPGENRFSSAGDIIEFDPDKYNHLVSLYGNLTTDPAITNTLTYSIQIKPRYNLL